MIIEGDVFEDIKTSKTIGLSSTNSGMVLSQDFDCVFIDKKQDVQLIAELQNWVDGGEIE
jgi:hypothetical protein